MTTPSRWGQTNADRIFLIGLIIWTVLQLSRFIALTLIDVINVGAEDEAWRYPAYLDLFAAVFAIPLAWAYWAKRNVTVWAIGIMYWAISIVDHFGNFVTTTHVGAPSIAEDMANPLLVPGIMTVFDTLFLILLMLPRFRRLFFQTTN